MLFNYEGDISIYLHIQLWMKYLLFVYLISNVNQFYDKDDYFPNQVIYLNYAESKTKYIIVIIIVYIILVTTLIINIIQNELPFCLNK